MSPIAISLPPASPDTLPALQAGEQILLSGIIYTGRDAAHRRLVDALTRGETLPVDLAGQVIYYAGPTPPRPGSPSGSIGPTTSGRMDRYARTMMEQVGLIGMIGKGERSAAVIDAMKLFGCVYFAAIGGAGALLAQSVTKSDCVAYPDLGAEAIYKLTILDFPVIVAIDSRGSSLYESGPLQWKKAASP